MAGARVFRVEFRIAVARRILNGESVSALSNELKIRRAVLYRWRDAYREYGQAGLDRPKGRPPGATTKAVSKTNAGAVPRRDREDSGVGASVGKDGAGKRFFKKSLQASKGRTLEEQRAWRSALYGEVMQLEGKAGLSILEACDAARVSRAGFYRRLDEHLPRQADTELRQQIQQICLENRCYGSRRVMIELQDLGRRVNRKRVMRLMRADNLLCLRKRRFVCNTDSRHTYAVYPNLIRDWKPNGINQLWVADITYIRLRESFLYLAVVLDAYSRRVVGWALGDALEAELALAALRSALADRPAPASLIHHSDRGVQYCSRAYVELLQSYGIRISMSRSGNPYDNALLSRKASCALSNAKKSI